MIQQDAELDSAIVMILSSLDDGRYMVRCRELDIELCIRNTDQLVHPVGEYKQGSREKAPVIALATSVVVDPWHILLAEDNHINQMVATGILEKRGHRVEVATNGQTAELFSVLAEVYKGR